MQTAATFSRPRAPLTPDDYELGVWFLDPKAGAPSLDLPVLPDGWVYEGWVVGEDGPVTTGRFLDPSAADQDGGGAAAGPDGTPPYPGQDFVNPPRDLRGGKVVISVEPEPDDSPMPFSLKPLVDGLVSDLPAPDSQMLMNRAADSEISGVANWR